VVSGEERKKAWASAVDALCKYYGVNVVLDTETRKYGGMVQIQAVMRLELVPNWTEHAPEITLSEVKDDAATD